MLKGENRMGQFEAQKPLWPWFVLIGGGIFLVTAGPGLLMSILLPFWRAEELGLFMYSFIIIAIIMFSGTIWGMMKAYQALKNQRVNVIPYSPEQSIKIQESHNSSINKKPIWPWVVIAPGALLLVGSGPGVIMLPIMPLFLAGMSTDSGNTPDYVPVLIFLVGYTLIIGYIILVVIAIKTLMRAGKRER
jgi:hypothetical protein